MMTPCVEMFRGGARGAVAAILAAVLAAPGAAGPLQEKPAEGAEKPGVPPGTRPPSLDELLGLDEEGTADGAADAAARDSRQELDRALSGRELADAFVVALEKMEISADLLDVRFDAGLGTQRLQEEILARLDELIDAAKKQMAGCGGPGMTTSGSRGERPGEPPPSGRPGQSARSSSGENRGEGEPPPPVQGDINTVIQESRSEWGHLPERVRDALRQGQGGYFSSLYKKLTQEYYIRLAEQGAAPGN